MKIDQFCSVGGKTIARIEGEFGGALSDVREETQIALVFTDGTQLKLYARIVNGEAVIRDN